MILSHIVAVSRNFIIGKDNHLPWRMPDDARYFHDLTLGHAVIMGRKNYEANRKALPGRANIVISRTPVFRPSDAFVVRKIDDAIEMAKDMGEVEAFIVGGGEIYKQTLDLIDKIYITLIDTETEGDTYYPEINFHDYKILSENTHAADDKNPFKWTYYVLEKPGKGR